MSRREGEHTDKGKLQLPFDAGNWKISRGDIDQEELQLPFDAADWKISI